TPPALVQEIAKGTEFCDGGPNWTWSRPSSRERPRPCPPSSRADRVNKSPKELAGVNNVNSCTLLNEISGTSACCSTGSAFVVNERRGCSAVPLAGIEAN